MPQTGHFHFDIIISLAGLEEAKNSNFLSNNFNTYLLLKEGTDAKALEAKLFDGDIDAARASLRLVGPRLKRIGRGS